MESMAALDEIPLVPPIRATVPIQREAPRKSRRRPFPQASRNAVQRDEKTSFHQLKVRLGTWTVSKGFR